MEAKIDVSKLQLLNDRINQTMEALNQVRFSVRGLSHTPAALYPQPVNALWGQPTGLYPQQVNMLLPGLQHSSAATLMPQALCAQYAQSCPSIGVQSNWLPGVQTQLPFAYAGGLSHTNIEGISGGMDPRACNAMRMAQSFPSVCAIV